MCAQQRDPSTAGAKRQDAAQAQRNQEKKQSPESPGFDKKLDGPNRPSV
ncbi:hypothetical protein IDH44_19195 [Paenibacillus sp. IB182496]|uniref:Uncharacterized protein n=1 Tax=Paenibacillus sabuli TaxID=2772509 RepID=A0A927BUZ7_9BACL|nr:hypothetical protein [Paenibacillus sabuli]MBD2847332.1 hypothetical protein [Paenibacillus sabuli]